MNRLEGRLRDAYQAAAQTVRPETIPAPPARLDPTGTSGRRRARFVIPLTAAAAVALIAVAAWAIGQQVGQTPLGTAYRLGPAAARALPPFLVTIPSTGRDLMIYRAATGQPLARTAPPRGLTFDAVAATGDNRSFIVAGSVSCSTRFYRLRLSRQGRSARLSALAVPEVHANYVKSMSASADGRTIAYSSEACASDAGRLSVAHVGQAAVRSWPLRSAMYLSLSADGRFLYFDSSTVFGGDGTVRVMHTDAPRRHLLRHARILLPASSGIDETGSTTVLPGGVMLGCLERGQIAILAAYNATTGAELGVIHSWPHTDAAPCTVTAAPAGGHAFIWVSAPGLGTQVDLVTGRARPEPGRPSANPPNGVAW